MDWRAKSMAWVYADIKQKYDVGTTTTTTTVTHYDYNNAVQ